MPLSSRLDVGPYYTVINRTVRTMTVIVDGRSFVFKPGRNPQIPSAVVPYALKQFPRLGTFGGDEDGESLLAVEGITPPAQCRLIAPGTEALGIERIDRAQFPDERGNVQFQKLSTAIGPQDRGPTILSSLEAPGSVVVGPAD